jgi:molybdopterin-binding protein
MAVPQDFFRKLWSRIERSRSLVALPNFRHPAYALGMTLSARNRLEGKVTEIQFGGVMAHVTIQVGKNVVESVITKRSVDEMKLKVGDKVTAVIKSTEVMLEK